MKETRIPHALRLVILLLRVALGLNFFYFGASILFGSGFGGGPVSPLLNLSASLTARFTFLPSHGPAVLVFVIGICLAVGFLTRLASLIGILLAVMNYTPFGGPIPLSPIQFASNTALVALCCLVVFFANAGQYFGLDRFIHLGVLPKKQK